MSKQDKWSRELQRNWGWLLGLGILLVILGSLSLVMMVSITLMSILFLGAMLIIAGLFQLMDAFQGKDWEGVLGHFVVAVLYLFGGGLVIYDPILASVVVTAMLAWTFIVIGIIRIMNAMRMKQTKGWGWMLFAGFMAVLLGGLILMQWPASSLWVIGLMIAIELLINGWSYILIALAMKPR